METGVKITFYNSTYRRINSIYLDCRNCKMVDIPPNVTMAQVCFSTESTPCANFDITDEKIRVSGNIAEGVSMMEVEDTDIVEYETPKLQKYPDFPEYVIESARLQTFIDWPKSMKQTPQQLSAAGFFYTQVADRVICFSCGGGLCEWEEKDDPWEQHAMYYEKCDYLRSMKGSEYISSVKSR